MRLLLTFLICLIFCWGLPAQGVLRGQDADAQQIPDAVKAHFLQYFDGAYHAEWRKKGTYFSVSFVLDELPMEATYSGTGIWMNTEIEIPLERFPPKAVAHYQAQYSRFEFINSGYHDEDGDRYYRIRIRRDGVIRTLRYDDQGTFIR